MDSPDTVALLFKHHFGNKPDNLKYFQGDQTKMERETKSCQNSKSGNWYKPKKMRRVTAWLYLWN